MSLSLLQSFYFSIFHKTKRTHIHIHMDGIMPKLYFSCRILEHDDSLTDRSEGGILDSNFHATKNLWYDVYNTEYKVAGGMYRGEPPKQFFDREWVFRAVMEQSQSQCHLPDGVNFAHLIGNVGASSVGRDGESKMMWMSIDLPEAFKEANPKSTTRGVNANEKMDSYVFGSGGMLGVLFHEICFH